MLHKQFALSEGWGMTILVMFYIGMVAVVAAAVSHQKQILRFQLRMTVCTRLSF
jgi:hypothetical protein